MVDGWSVITDVLWKTRTRHVSDDSEMSEVFIGSWWIDDQWLQTRMCSGKPEHVEWVSEPRPGLGGTSSSSFFLKKKKIWDDCVWPAALVLNFNKLAWAHAHLKKTSTSTWLGSCQSWWTWRSWLPVPGPVPVQWGYSDSQFSHFKFRVLLCSG